MSELALEGRSDGRCHDVGAGSGKPRVDVDGGEIDLGQRRSGQHSVGDGAGDGDGGGDKGGRDRGVDEWSGETHAIPYGALCRRRSLLWRSSLWGQRDVAGGVAFVVFAFLREALRDPIKEDVYNWRGVEREHLA